MTPKEPPVGTELKAERLLASIWYYGGWKAETRNERELQRHMESVGLWPIESEADLIARLDTRPPVEASEDVVERVARAMARELGYGSDAWNSSGFQVRSLVALARAALAAIPATVLVEPREAMIEAGQKAYDTPDGPSINDFDTEVEWQRAYVAYLYRAMQSAAPGSSEGDKHKRAQDEYRRLKGGDDVDDAAFEAALNAPGSSEGER